MLLNLEEHSWPDIANMTQELSKIVDGENQAAFLEIHQVIKYVLHSRSLELKLEPNGSEKEPHDIVCFIDNDYAEFMS